MVGNAGWKEYSVLRDVYVQGPEGKAHGTGAEGGRACWREVGLWQGGEPCSLGFKLRSLGLISNRPMVVHQNVKLEVFVCISGGRDETGQAVVSYKQDPKSGEQRKLLMAEMGVVVVESQEEEGG